MTEAIAKAKKARTKKKTASRRKRTEWPGWLRLIPERCTKNLAARKLFISSFVSLTTPAQTTHREKISAIAAGANIPFLIESLGDGLDTGKTSRGETHFKYLGDVIDNIAENIPDMRWWLTDKGLNMEIIQPESMLSPFDAVALELCLKHWTTPTLSKASLQLIARELDAKAASFPDDFLDQFPSTSRKLLAEYNQRNPRVAIRTFEAAAANRKFSGLVRKLLYRARERFARANVSDF